MKDNLSIVILGREASLSKAITLAEIVKRKFMEYPDAY